MVSAADAEGCWPAGRQDAGCQWPLPEMQGLKEGVWGLAGGPQKGMKTPPRLSRVSLALPFLLLGLDSSFAYVG